LSLGTPPFLLVMCCVVMVLRVLVHRGQRRLLLSALNLSFLVPLVPNWESALGLAGFVGGTYGLLRLERRRPGPAFVPLAIAFACLLFLVVKRYAFLDGLLPDTWFQALELVGLSYMLFRFIHVLVDQSQGQVAGVDLYAYANYQLSFLGLLAGPIQRWNAIQASWDAPEPPFRSAAEDLASWRRVLGGMLKMGVLAPLAAQLLEACGTQGRPGSPGPLPLLAAHLYLYPVYLYANFSGYTDIVVGYGELAGIRIPDNFNRPFLARNLLDFWDRWHITLTRWIRDYVFMTSYKALAERHPGRARELGYGLLFLSLLVAGVWHGSTERFVVFGLLHGLGAALAQAWGDALRSRLGRKGFARYLEDRRIRFAARFLTFHYVCFTFLVFALGVDGTLERLGALRGAWAVARLGPPGPATLALLVLVPLLLVLYWRPERPRGREPRPVPAARVLMGVVALQLLALSLFWLGFRAFDGADPVVVYQRF
jgi:alginate O-acetyltransferase complex protein AlgI